MFNRPLGILVGAALLSGVASANPAYHGKLKELLAAQNAASAVYAGEGATQAAGVYSFLAGHGVKVQFCQAEGLSVVDEAEAKVAKVYYCENDHGKSDWKCEAEDIAGKQLACGLASAPLAIDAVAEALSLSGKQILKDKPRGYNSVRDVVTVPVADGVKSYFCKKNRSTRKLEITYQYNCAQADDAMTCSKVANETTHEVCTAVTKAD